MERINKILEFLKQQPQDSFLQHALALEYIKIDYEAKAKEIFIKLLTENENYVGSYYHLAKIFERENTTDQAIFYYKKGMEIAKQQKDNHAYNELQAACEEIEEW